MTSVPGFLDVSVPVCVATESTYSARQTSETLRGMWQLRFKTADTLMVIISHPSTQQAEAGGSESWLPSMSHLGNEV